jgi:hypothetical protein
LKAFLRKSVGASAFFVFLRETGFLSSDRSREPVPIGRSRGTLQISAVPFAREKYLFAGKESMDDWCATALYLLRGIDRLDKESIISGILTLILLDALDRM